MEGRHASLIPGRQPSWAATTSWTRCGRDQITRELRRPGRPGRSHRAGRPRPRRTRAVEGRHVLARQNQRDRVVPGLHDPAPGFDDLVRVSGTAHEAGHERSAARCSIGWCVGPSSPTPIESCEDRSSGFHDRAQTGRGSHSPRRSGPDPGPDLREREAVRIDPTRAADAEVEVAAVPVVGGESPALSKVSRLGRR